MTAVTIKTLYSLSRFEKLDVSERILSPHQRDFTPVDKKLRSELLVTADDGLHLLTTAQLVVGALHLTQARREGDVSAHHHVHATGGKKKPTTKNITSF